MPTSFGNPGMFARIIRQNPDVEFNWAGWVSTPRRLEASGWRISVRDESHPRFMERTVTFAVSLPGSGVSGLTEPMDLHLMEYLSRQHPMGKMSPMRMRMNLGQPLQIRFMGEPDMFHRFEPHDPVPRFLESEAIDLDKFKIFSSIPRSTEQILLDDVSLDQVLDIALSKQKGIQDRYNQFKHEEELLRRSEPMSEPSRILRLVG